MAKTKDIFNFSWENKVTITIDPTQGLYGILAKTRKNIYF